jgi:hypothetical protein
VDSVTPQSVRLSLLVTTFIVALTPHVFMSGRIVGLDGARLPKELVMGIGSGLAATVAMSCRPAARLGKPEALLITFGALSTVSALISAGDFALAARALLLTVAPLLTALSFQQLASGDDRQKVLLALVGSAAAVAAIVVMEGFHVLPRMSMEHRGPGGTFLQRNHAAHFLACMLPLTMYVLAHSHNRAVYLATFAATALIACAIVLSRSRAAWLTVILSCSTVLLLFACVFPAVWRTPPLGVERFRRDLRMWAAAVLVGAALAIPMVAYVWGSIHALESSASRLLDYSDGSGRGRLLQLSVTAQIASSHLAFGVGPGQWPISYAAAAPASDPSLLPGIKRVDDRPLNEWVGLAAERGLPAVIVLGAAVICLLARATQLAASDVGRGATASAVIVTVYVLGNFDAVASDAATMQFVGAVVGVLLPPPGPCPSRRGATRRRFAMCVLLFVFATSAVSVFGQAIGTWLYHSRLSEARLRRALQFHPFDYRARMLLALSRLHLEDCRGALSQLSIASRLRPTFPAPHQLAATCGHFTVSSSEVQAGKPRAR